MKIVVDGMGGDHSPGEIIKGCVEAIKEMTGHIFIVGDEEKIQLELDKYDYDKSTITIIHASEVITNDDKPVKAVRRKKDSSIVVGMNMVKEKKADAFISAGNTGAIMTGALFILGRISGIDRPVISSIFPSLKGFSLIVDAGANAECKPHNLVEFGIMGSIYSEKVLGKKNPSVALVNIGSEEAKGTQTIQTAHMLMKETQLNFQGNIEAREIPEGKADVVVCDGFVGNVILKLSEGIVEFFMTLLKEKFKESFLVKMGALIMSGKLKEMKKELDYSEYGGAPILGVKGAVIKMHGSSEAKAVKNAILRARPYIENDVVEMIHQEVLKIESIKSKEMKDV